MTWTANIMPDDALDPESLVGRMLRPEPEITAEEAEMIAAPWSYLEPPATVEPMPPLLRAMTVASGQLLDATFGDATSLQCWAAEIEALRDWLPDMPPPDLLQQWCDEAACYDLVMVRRTMDWVRALLTEQAGIARGEA